MKINWRPYQSDTIKAVENAMQRNVRRQLIVSATGTGKRLLAVGMSKKFDFNKILFLAHTEELIEQARIDFEKMFPLQVGIVKAERFEIDKKIVIASAQTIWRRLDKMPEDMFDCVMADEVHHYLARTYIMPLEHFKYKHMFGFTATPTRLDGLNFTNIIDEIVFDYPLDQAIKEGFLCQLDAVRTKTKIDISKVKRNRGDFSPGELSAILDIDERNKLIVEKYNEYAKGRQAIVFCSNIEHAENVAQMFRENNITAEAMHSKIDRDQRKSLNKRYRDKILSVLTNVNILTEGWDYDDVGAVLMARPTQSLALYMQMIGRGTRLKSNQYKKLFGLSSCKIIDFVDVSGNHELINTWELDKVKSAEDQVFVTEEKKEENIKNRNIISEKRNSKIKAVYGTDKPLDLIGLPTKKVVRKSAHWYHEPATAAQLGFLRGIGVWNDNIDYTKGQASNAISNAKANANMKKKLVGWKHNILNMENGEELDVTVGQFYEVKNELFPKQDSRPNF